MRANPRAGWTIGDVRVVCDEYGVTLASPTRGSHYKVSHESQSSIVTIPSRRPIKPVYIRRLVEFIDDVREAEQ